MNLVQQFKQRWYVLAVILITATLLFSTYLPVTGRPTSQEGISQPQAFTSGGTMNFQGQLSDMGGNPRIEQSICCFWTGLRFLNNQLWRLWSDQ